MREQRILVVKLSSLGDLFHALPAVHELKTRLPARIDWVVQREYAELAAACFTDVDRVLAFDRRRWARRPGVFLRELRRERYDLVLDMQGLLKSALVARLARGARRVGPSFHREGARLFYHAVAGPRDKQRHAVEENLDVVRYLGLEPGPPRFGLRAPPWPVERPRPRVALAPSSRWPSKNWPPASFAAAARRLRDGVGASLFLLGAPGDRPLCDAVASAIGGPVENLAGRTSLVEMAGALAGMDLLIANDSGPVHMAAALGTPVLVLFGPTDPARTGPFGPGHRVLTPAVPCRPCFQRDCTRPGGTCLETIAPERVARAAMEMLLEAGGERRPSPGLAAAGTEGGGA